MVHPLADAYLPFLHAAAAIRPAGRLKDGAAALEVYQRSYWARLTESLGANYPAVWSVLGDERFFELSLDYIQQHPSQVYNLSHYGESFPEYVRRHEVSGQAPFLADLARLEWAFSHLFHQKQHISLAPEVWAEAMLSPQTRLIFGEAVAFFEAPYLVFDMWKGAPASNWEGDEQLLLYKSDERVFVNRFAQTEFCALKLLSNGHQLADLERGCGGALEPEQIAGLFYFIATSGIISKLE